ncbi:unnamed protein product [Somion occarium]|uniref:Transmembrane protein n=1 Tax=Somion occarium TaxID=3059160 RepID=A0ABP1CYH5_9APHY
MPGPAVYVVVAVATVAAAIAFEQFVYEPHIAPRLEAFAQAFIENRRRRRLGPVAVSQNPPRTDENQARRDGGKKKHDDDDEPTSVELQNLVAREVDEWRNGVQRKSTLRNRKTPTVIDESNGYIPYNPLTPSQVIFDASSSKPLPDPPSSVQSGQSSLHDSRPLSPHSAPARPEMQQTPTFKSPIILSPRLPTPISNISPVSTRATSPAGSQLDHSVSSMSSFAPAVVGPRSSESLYGSPRSHATGALSDAGRSGLNVLSDSPSRVTSPFSDFYSASADRVGL